MLCDLHVSDREQGKPLLLITPHCRSRLMGPRFFFPPPMFFRRAAAASCDRRLSPPPPASPVLGTELFSTLGDRLPSLIDRAIVQFSNDMSISKMPCLCSRTRMIWECFSQHWLLAGRTRHDIDGVIQRKTPKQSHISFVFFPRTLTRF